MHGPLVTASASVEGMLMLPTEMRYKVICGPCSTDSYPTRLFVPTVLQLAAIMDITQLERQPDDKKYFREKTSQ